MTILLIDDDPEILLVACYALEKRGGHRVVCAADGGEALARARAERLDAIVMDIVLPDLEAAELLVRLRRGPNRAVPVVLLTARHAPPEAHAPGVVGVIEKPFDPLTLEQEIGRLIAVAT